MLSPDGIRLLDSSGLLSGMNIYEGESDCRLGRQQIFFIYRVSTWWAAANEQLSTYKDFSFPGTFIISSKIRGLGHINHVLDIRLHQNVTYDVTQLCHIRTVAGQSHAIAKIRGTSR